MNKTSMVSPVNIPLQNNGFVWRQSALWNPEESRSCCCRNCQHSGNRKVSDLNLSFFQFFSLAEYIKILMKLWMSFLCLISLFFFQIHCLQDPDTIWGYWKSPWSTSFRRSKELYTKRWSLTYQAVSTRQETYCSIAQEVMGIGWS
jgi:hypothetical protein